MSHENDFIHHHGQLAQTDEDFSGAKSSLFEPGPVWKSTVIEVGERDHRAGLIPSQFVRAAKSQGKNSITNDAAPPYDAMVGLLTVVQSADCGVVESFVGPEVVHLCGVVVRAPMAQEQRRLYKGDMTLVFASGQVIQPANLIEQGFVARGDRRKRSLAHLFLAEMRERSKKHGSKDELSQK